MGECWQCKYWDSSQWIMNKHREGCGRCELDGEIRFCPHKRTFSRRESREK